MFEKGEKKIFDREIYYRCDVSLIASSGSINSLGQLLVYKGIAGADLYKFKSASDVTAPCARM